MRAYLDDHLLPTESNAGWEEVAGTAPVRRVFRMPNKLAADITQIDAATPGDTTLTIDATDEGLQSLTFHKLSIIGVGPTSSPHEVDLVVVDLRWLWKYKHIYASFNVPRKTGTIRRIGSVKQTVVQTLIDDIGFAAWSLKGGTTAWKPLEVLRFIMDAVVGPNNWTGRGLAAINLGEIQDLTIDAPGDAAIAQLLSDPAFGGALNVYQNRVGQIIVYNRFDDSERSLVGAPLAISAAVGASAVRPLARPAIVGQPLWIEQVRVLERPYEVHVLFERRVELRIDCVEKRSQITEHPSSTPPLYAINVLPSPEDFTHKFKGKARTIISEQWIELEFYLDYLKFQTPAAFSQPLSLAVLAKGWASNAIEIYAEVDTSGKWGRRIDYIRQHYRLSWQILKTWRDRIREIKAERLCSEDRETGARPNAIVFANYAQFNTWRSSGSRFQASDKAMDIVSNRFANPQGTGGGDIIGTDYTKMQPAPALLSIADNEQGIFHFEFGRGSDNTYKITRWIRSALTKGSIPTDDPTEKNQWLQEGRLEDKYEASVILTADLGAPPDNRRYHKIKVTEAQAAAVLPTGRSQIGTGPVMEVRVKPSILVSRHAWEDSSKSKIEALFAPQGFGAPMPNLQNVLPTPVNEDTLKGYALGIAAQVYGEFLDRVEGGLTTGLNDTMTLTGTATKVSHEADPDLGAITRVTVPQDPPQLDISALLPKSVRAVVSRVVDPPI